MQPNTLRVVFSRYKIGATELREFFKVSLRKNFLPIHLLLLLQSYVHFREGRKIIFSYDFLGLTISEMKLVNRLILFRASSVARTIRNKLFDVAS